MKNIIIAMKYFDERFGNYLPSSPTANIPQSVIELRKKLIKEESKELLEAIDIGNLDHIAKELIDLTYVALGTGITYGLENELEAIFNEVHRSNLSKLDENGNPIHRADGKVVKSEKYSSADIKSIINRKKVDIKGRQDRADHLYTQIACKNFDDVQKKLSHLVQIAEEQNHHPTVTFGYNSIEIITTTHDEGNKITEKDIEIAQKINEIR